MGSLLDKITLPSNYAKNQVAPSTTKSTLPVKLDTTLRSQQSSKKDAIVQQTLKNGSSNIKPLPSTKFQSSTTTSKPQSQKTATEIANTKTMQQKIADNYQRQANAVAQQKANPLTTIKDGEWGIAICDNSQQGQKITDWGYMTTSVKNGVDGQAYLINNKGEIKSLHTGTESEDYMKKVREVEEAAKESKEKFELAHRFQEMAQEEAELHIQDGDDPDSVADIVKRLVYTQGRHNSGVLNDEEYAWDMQDIIMNQAKKYWETRESTQWVETHNKIGTANQLKAEYIDRYQHSTKEERLNMYKELYADDRLTQRQKNQVAYVCNYGEHKVSWLKAGLGTVNEAIDAMPSNLIGDTIAGGVIAGINGDSVAEGMERGFLGKQNTTGNTLTDLAIYMFTDPGMLASLGKSAAKVATSIDVGKMLKTDDILKTLKIGSAITGGETAEETARILAQSMHPEDADEFIKTVTDMLQYKKDYQIAKSLQRVDDALADADHLAARFTTAGLTGTGVHKVIQRLTKSDVSAKCINDAVAQTVGDASKEIDVTAYSNFIQRYERNLASCSLADFEQYSARLSLTPDEKYQMFADVYMNQRRKASNIAQLNKDAADTMVELGMDDTPLYQTLVGGVDVDYTLKAHRAKALPVDYSAGQMKQAELRNSLSFLNDDSVKVGDLTTDRLYTMKYNDTLIADSIRQNEMYRAVCSDTPSKQLMEMFDDAQAGQTLRELWASGIGTRNYENIVNRINQSVHIPTDLKDSVIDFLYNRKFRATVSRAMYGEAITAAAMTQKARSLASKWLDGAHSMDAAWKSSEKYLNYACNTSDTVSNVNNIAKLFSSNPALAVDKTDYIFYSAKLSPTGILENVSVNFKGEVHTFAVDQLQDMDQWVLETMSESQRVNNRVKFIGFNNHATGFDTDFAMQAEFKRHRVATASRFLHSTDLAEVIRVNEGLAIDLHGGVYDRMLDELTDTVEEAIHNWQIESVACEAIGYKPAFSMTVPTYDEFDSIVDRLNNVDSTRYLPEQAEFIGRMTEDLGLTTHYLNTQQQALTKDLGWLELTDDVLRKVREAAGPEVAMTTFLDKKKMLRWADCEDMPIKDTVALKQAVNTIDSTAKQFYCDEFFDTFKGDIDQTWNYLMNDMFTGSKGQANKTIGLRLGIITDDNRFLLKADTPQEKTAVMMYLRHNGIFTDTSIATSFDDALRQAYGSNGLIVRPTGRYYVADETLQGSVGNMKSSWNIQEQQYKAMHKLTDSFDRLDDLEEFRRANDLTRPLDVQNIKVRHELKSEYEAIKDDMLINAPSHPDSMIYTYGANRYAQFWNFVQDEGMFDRSNAMWSNIANSHEFDKMLWLGKIMEAGDLEQYVAKYCHGRLVVDISNLSTVQRGRVVQKFVDAGMTHEGNLLKFSTDIKAGDYIAPALKMPEALTACAKYNNETFTFGQFLPDDFANHKFFMDKYFPGEEYKVLEDTASTGYFCSYIGPVTGMVGEGSYASANTLTNLFNSYNRTLQLVDHKEQLVESVFSGPNFANWCGMTDPSVVHDELFKRGYLILGYNDKGVLDLTSKSTDQILNFNGRTAVVGAEDWKKLNETLTFKPVTNEALHKLKTFANDVRGKYIKFQLFTNPGTGVHNMIDSSLKATLTEGADHIPYMAEAAYTLGKYDELEKYISKTYGYDVTKVEGIVRNHNITVETINKAFKDGVDFGISKERALQMLQLKGSTLFDTKMSEFFKEGSAMQKWNVIGKLNEKMFTGAEHINRTAIALRHLDMGDTMDGAYKAIKASQFDYAKNGFLKAMDTVSPFSTFKFYNVEYWMHTAIQQANAPLMRAYYRFKDSQDFGEMELMSEDEMRWRAWLDTLPDNDYEREVKTYNSWRDYQGTKQETADEYGWLKIGDKYYFKSGESITDMMNGETFCSLLDIFADRDKMESPTDWVDAVWDVFKDKLFDPYAVGIDLLKGEYQVLNKETYKDIDSWVDVEDIQNNKAINALIQLTPLYPVVTAAKTAVRQYLYTLRDSGSTAEAIRDAGLYSLISRGASDGDIDWYATKMYLNRAVGIDWYSMTEAEQKKFRYVMGISYVPAWVAKDPTTYIDTFGRLAEMGIGFEQAQWLMDNGGALWFTQNNEGEYELHNYKLMCGDVETYNAWFDKLVNFWGWSEKKAQTLLDKIAEPMWQTKQYKAYTYGYKSNGATDISQVRGYGRFKNSRLYSRTSPSQRKYSVSKSSFNKIRYAGFNSEFSKFSGSWSRYDKHPKQWGLASRLQNGKNVDFSGYGLKRYNQGIDMGGFKRTYPRWHRRTRDIYNNNYARYGASRMAMEQNLRNYSNRSITEMRRTNQAMRYADIHRHTAW